MAPPRCSCPSSGGRGCCVNLLQMLTHGMPENREPSLLQDSSHNISLPCTTTWFLLLPHRCEDQKGRHCWAGARTTHGAVLWSQEQVTLCYLNCFRHASFNTAKQMPPRLHFWSCIPCHPWLCNNQLQAHASTQSMQPW